MNQSRQNEVDSDRVDNARLRALLAEIDRMSDGITHGARAGRPMSLSMHVDDILRTRRQMRAEQRTI
ncbi:MAG: hypothetical protein ACQEWM_06075 [Actinomycetota bacterium]